MLSARTAKIPITPFPFPTEKSLAQEESLLNNHFTLNMIRFKNFRLVLITLSPPVTVFVQWLLQQKFEVKQSGNFAVLGCYVQRCGRLVKITFMVFYNPKGSNT
jgi:hypothetical protein